MKPTKEIIDVVNQAPDLDKQGKVHGDTWEKSTAVYDKIVAKGRDGYLQVAGMLTLQSAPFVDASQQEANFVPISAILSAPQFSA